MGEVRKSWGSGRGFRLIGRNKKLLVVGRLLIGRRESIGRKPTRTYAFSGERSHGEGAGLRGPGFVSRKPRCEQMSDLVSSRRLWPFCRIEEGRFREQGTCCEQMGDLVSAKGTGTHLQQP